MNKKIWLGVGLVTLVLAGGLAVVKQRQMAYRGEDAVATDDVRVGKPFDDENEPFEVSDEDEEQGEDSEKETGEGSTTPVDTTIPPDQASAPKVAGYTLTDVATHSTKENCWSAVNGNVYDLTSWVPKHPGGDAAIAQICGKDGSALFAGQHGGAAKQASILATFKIGVLQ
ncbi:MAG: cytochrome b5 domain-containing protein [Patescibacteria group bacterium]